MRLVVLATIARSLKGSIQQPEFNQRLLTRIGSLLGVISPLPVQLLFADESHEVERLVILVCLGTRVTQESLLIELLGNLLLDASFLDTHVQDALRSHAEKS